MLECHLSDFPRKQRFSRSTRGKKATNSKEHLKPTSGYGWRVGWLPFRQNTQKPFNTSQVGSVVSHFFSVALFFFLTKRWDYHQRSNSCHCSRRQKTAFANVKGEKCQLITCHSRWCRFCVKWWIMRCFKWINTDSILQNSIFWAALARSSSAFAVNIVGDGFLRHGHRHNALCIPSRRWT